MIVFISHYIYSAFNFMGKLIKKSQRHHEGQEPAKGPLVGILSRIPCGGTGDRSELLGPIWSGDEPATQLWDM
jgi:hypothetical protein